jgi:membrane-associated phospholipid phosphatase
MKKGYIKLPKYFLIIIFVLAVFISTGVSFGHHWLSEAVAGGMFGFVVGKVVSEGMGK